MSVSNTMLCYTVHVTNEQNKQWLKSALCQPATTFNCILHVTGLILIIIVCFNCVISTFTYFTTLVYTCSNQFLMSENNTVSGCLLAALHIPYPWSMETFPTLWVWVISELVSLKSTTEQLQLTLKGIVQIFWDGVISQRFICSRGVSAQPHFGEASRP